MLTDGDSVKATYAHKVDANQTVGGEVIKNLAKETTAFTLGYSKRMEGGAFFKARLNNAGELSAVCHVSCHYICRLCQLNLPLCINTA